MISKCQQKNLKILEYVTLKLTISVIYALFCTESYLLDTKLVTDHLFGKMAGWKYLQFDKTTGEFKRRFTTKRRPVVKKSQKKKTAIKKNFFDETTPNSCHADCDTNKQGEETPSIQEL